MGCQRISWRVGSNCRNHSENPDSEAHHWLIIILCTPKKSLEMYHFPWKLCWPLSLVRICCTNPGATRLVRNWSGWFLKDDDPHDDFLNCYSCWLLLILESFVTKLFLSNTEFSRLVKHFMTNYCSKCSLEWAICFDVADPQAYWDYWSKCVVMTFTFMLKVIGFHQNWNSKLYQLAER